jgi:FKBP-type peptidyl-prolyl cis-trans isomerase FkpA
MRLRRLAAALLPLAFMACLEGTEASTNPFPNIPIEQTTFAAGLEVNLAASTKTASGLYYRDITPGTGATVTSTSTVTVYYTANFPDGQLLEQIISPSAPAGPITLGRTPPEVIAGWEEGLVGMKVGGIRQLIIPPSLAYGAGGSAKVPPNAVLVFRVEMKTAQ